MAHMESAAGSSNPHVRVLVIDDDDVDRERCTRYLQNRSDIDTEVIAVEKTDEAEDLMRDTQFDCVLVDFNLGEETGLDFAQRHQGDQDPPIILLTGSGNEAIASEALRAGVTEYVTKANLTANGLRRAVGSTLERARLRASLRLQNQMLQNANSTLVRQNCEIQRFYHTLSHELKTPLAAAREFVSLVSDGVAGELNWQQREYLQHAVACCDQLAVHFNDLVDSVRLETGKFTLSREVVQVDALVVRTLTAMANQARGHKVSLKHSIAAGMPPAYVDASRVLQVLANLVSNGIKAVPEGGWVHVGVEQPDRHSVRVTVSDNGCGISPEHQDRIFDRLYQVTSTNEYATAAGLGLGLYIAREIVQEHGGELVVESSPGHGSTFSFTLPIGRTDAASPEVL